MPSRIRPASQSWSLPRWMTIRYVTALLLIALFATGAFLMTEEVLYSHSQMVDVVNSSGRQRMLSQRAALMVEKLANGEAGSDQGQLIRTLDETITLFETTHQRLTHDLKVPLRGRIDSGQNVEGAAELLDVSVKTYVTALRAVAHSAANGQRPDQADVQLVMDMALGSLLPQLEEMVARYQEIGEEGIATLHWLGQLALLLTLVTLCVEALLIFQPMVRQVKRQFAEIRQMTEALHETNATLEKQVALRTRELFDAKVAAEHANHAKSRFLAHASHDLKQPLEAIGMFTGILERQVTGQRGLALIHDLRAAQRSMRALLNAVLELSRLESGVVEPRLVAMPLQPLFDQLLAEFAPAADARGLRLRAVRTNAWIKGDPLLLERILRNLLANAVRYTESGGVLFGCRRNAKGLLSIMVCDSGPGIAAADCNRIFEEFVQLDRRDRDRSEGIGLGLAIVDRLARLMGQHLTLQSRVGHGTSFALTVVQIDPADDPAITTGDLALIP